MGGPRATKWPRAKGWGRVLGLKDRTRVKGQDGGVGTWVKGWGRDLGWEGTGFVIQSLLTIKNS